MIGRYEPYVFVILRVIAGLMFLLHGSQKIFGWPGGSTPSPAFASLPWVAGILELVVGGLIVIGLLTPIAAFIASGEMAVAYFMAHAPGGFFPILNRGELAVLYCFLWLYIAAHGSGIWSVDHAIASRRTAAVA